mmetsp:Transcript_28926/g.44466  ORF Transcript_28926/g.44466 Transcript_28926/m.44466 type:complete len:356 (-) Transcript_28926:60-1127(-)|eukprot:CAMPEP_0118702496 /NCGR_PEP_ID=MMETSP0800-20121206/17927_1 /TAXON_ID=210618 ORGANISM="Striatella unipunctata, Strain CCMP2910" /NCGR_SAMPLE_ID=MMETSP0800 /ASSEMBLY_ACC=CAM_ASM_000638 /LENGTH=355 /DNA_ID=CAMNT_0006603711 /DNA_START=157 /DNA_END=1224 /DNA_ORIENTATION=+
MATSCALAAASLFMSNVFDIIQEMRNNDLDEFDWEKWLELDPTYLIKEWDYRFDTRQLFIASKVSKAMALIFTITPIWQLSWLLSNGGKRMMGLHALMSLSILFGSGVEWTGMLMALGLERMTFFFSSFNLDQWTETTNSLPNDKIGWRTLDMTNTLYTGLFKWVDAFESLVIFIVMTCIFVSFRSSPDPPLIKSFGTMSLLIGLIALINFIVDIARERYWTLLDRFAKWIAFLNFAVMLPIWFIWLGRGIKDKLPKLDDPPEASEYATGEPSVEMQSIPVEQPTWMAAAAPAPNVAAPTPAVQPTPVTAPAPIVPPASAISPAAPPEPLGLAPVATPALDAAPPSAAYANPFQE